MIVLPLIFLIIINSMLVRSYRIDCCLEKYSSLGVGCESDVVVGNQTYTCVPVPESCPSCAINEDVSSLSCYQCCNTERNACGARYAYIDSSSWTLIGIIFIGSCFCFSVVFISAEQDRLKDGISFRDAYLIPIPLVDADLEAEEKLHMLPSNQPTAIAKIHGTIDYPVARPTEHSPLISFFLPDREY